MHLLKKMSLDEAENQQKRQDDQDNQPEFGEELVGCCNQSFEHTRLAMRYPENFIVRPWKLLF